MRVLLVDDERLARDEMRRLLAAHPDVAIAGEACDADEAERLIAALSPDVLFLDVQMPGRSGFELLEALDSVPAVVFTTAYDQFALRAFEVSALDYLVKPVAPKRLDAALARARRHLRAPDAVGGQPLQASLAQVFVRDGERCWFVRLTDIELFESEGNYTRLFFGAERPLIRRSLIALESRLDPSQFFRANRHQIINLRAVTTAEPSVADGLLVTLASGQRVEISRRQSQHLRNTMGL